MQENLELAQFTSLLGILILSVIMAHVNVGELLTPKTLDDDVGPCLARLVMALEMAKAEDVAKAGGRGMG